jgi:hypothetical protein
MASSDTRVPLLGTTGLKEWPPPKARTWPDAWRMACARAASLSG